MSDKGLSTSTKILIGFCLGFLSLVILFFVGSAIFGGIFFKNITQPILEESFEETKEEETPPESPVKFPEFFPKDIPLYPGADVIRSIEAGTTSQVVLKTSDEINKVIGYYEEEMGKNGWEEGTSFEFDRGRTTSYTKNHNRNSVIAIEYDEIKEATVVNITYEEREVN